MKMIVAGLILFLLSCNNSDVDNSTLHSADSNSRKAVDSSAIINQHSKLPADSVTTVSH
jgi:hypothetical protein